MEKCLAAARILLVEDESLIRLILAEALTDAGFCVTEAETGDDAAELADGPNGFDVLLTDIHMPGRLDGIALARRVRLSHPDVPIVFMTGRPDAMAAMDGLGPHEALIRKPYGPSEVLGTIERLLRTG